MEAQKFRHEKTYPIILVNTKLGLLRIVYRNSTTSFKLQTHETKQQLDNEFSSCDDGWTPEGEVEMAVGSGYHRVNDSDNKRWELWGAGKEKGVLS